MMPEHDSAKPFSGDADRTGEKMFNCLYRFHR